MTRLVVATTNRDKIAEIRRLLDGAAVDIITLDRWPGTPAPEETGATFEENARAKALYYAGVTGGLTMAEDSGLVIEALDGRPGVESARFGGEALAYPGKFALIYDELRSRRVNGSRAQFVCAPAVASGPRIIFETRGIVEGRIAPEPRGTGGFGYDPIFFYPPFGMTLAEAGERKSDVSHRAKAIRALRAFLLAPASRAPR
jgi:XTP/dITP diphosphohydrolase